MALNSFADPARRADFDKSGSGAGGQADRRSVSPLPPGEGRVRVLRRGRDPRFRTVRIA
jgi:hypothetical protein